MLVTRERSFASHSFLFFNSFQAGLQVGLVAESIAPSQLGTQRFFTGSCNVMSTSNISRGAHSLLLGCGQDYSLLGLLELLLNQEGGDLTANSGN